MFTRLNIILIICYIYVALFWVLCSIHLDDTTAAILHQNAHHTPVYWWRGDRQMGEFGQDTKVTPLLFFKGHPRIFNDHRESGPQFNVWSEGQCSLQYSVSPSLHWGFRTHTDNRVSTPCWPQEHLFQQQPSFPTRSPIQVLTRLNLLSFSGCRRIHLFILIYLFLILINLEKFHF